MGDHTNPVSGRPEPVLLLDAAKALLAVGVGLGWVYLDNSQVELLLTALGAVLAVVLTFVTRRAVTPVSDPIALDGSLLVPVSDLLSEE